MQRWPHQGAIFSVIVAANPDPSSDQKHCTDPIHGNFAAEGTIYTVELNGSKDTAECIIVYTSETTDYPLPPYPAG